MSNREREAAMEQTYREVCECHGTFAVYGGRVGVDHAFIAGERFAEANGRIANLVAKLRETATAPEPMPLTGGSSELADESFRAAWAARKDLARELLADLGEEVE